MVVYIYNLSWLQFPLQNQGVGTPKPFDSGERACTPTFLQNQDLSVGKYWKNSKIIHFGHVAGELLIL
jgi:hypothetical protein